MPKTKTFEISSLPGLKLLDAQQGYRQRNEVLSSFVQDYFSENADVINVLEAGCGRSWHLDLGGIKFKLAGVDISAAALELRRINEGDLDRAIVGDLRNVELDQEEFDIVYCVDVIEHINGADEVLNNFFTWLKPEGLLILVFPNRDTVLGFITRVLPHWVRVLYYKYVAGYPNSGKPGFGPFPVYYDKIVSRRAIHDYCYRHGHSIALEYGRPSHLKRLGWLASGARVLFKFLQYLSFGKLAADHWGLVYVIQKQ
jgi:SAM-dependent methyltransferase